MKKMHFDESLGKVYDAKLISRLLRYARPYWLPLFLCIIILTVIAAIDLARPYIIKIAIDEYILVGEQPYYIYDEPLTRARDGFFFQSQYFIQVKDPQLYPPPRAMAYLRRNKANEGYILEFKEEERINYSLTLEEIKLFRKSDIQSIAQLSGIYLLLIGLALLLNFIQVYLLNYTSNKIIYQIRKELFTHLQRMPLSFFDKNPVGRLVTRVTNDTETLHEMYTGVLVNLFKDVFILAGIFIIMLRLNTSLALLSFTVVPIIILSTILFRSRVREAYREVRVKLAKINSLLNENLTGIKTVHIFKREEQQFKEFDKVNREHLEANKKQIFIFAIFRPSMEIIRSLGIAIIIWYGGGQVIQQTMEFGVLFAFINYIKQFFQPINDLTEKYNILQSAMASSERIFDLLDTTPDIEDAEHPEAIQKLEGKIEFKNVWFAYNPGEWVLKDISFTINPGESIAFVGATGAGKSSIINLIGRFYDIQKGEILIDGVDIRQIPLKILRQNIGIVLQDVFLFTGTIKENISLGNEQISDKSVQEVAKYVNAHRFIEQLPQQYDEPVMERGSTLSSGQRQLLSFARALIFKPSILVLDEATSNIDTETEELIQDAVAKLIKGRTTIAIAHRLSTIQDCDQIIVLHKGRLREQGSHQELLQMEGIYYHLYQLQ